MLFVTSDCILSKCLSVVKRSSIGTLLLAIVDIITYFTKKKYTEVLVVIKIRESILIYLLDVKVIIHVITRIKKWQFCVF